MNNNVNTHRIFLSHLQAVASKLHGTEVEVEIVQTKKDCDHVQFLITERSNQRQEQYEQAAEIEILSLGKLTSNSRFTKHTHSNKLEFIILVKNREKKIHFSN